MGIYDNLYRLQTWGQDLLEGTMQKKQSFVGLLAAVVLCASSLVLSTSDANAIGGKMMTGFTVPLKSATTSCYPDSSTSASAYLKLGGTIVNSAYFKRGTYVSISLSSTTVQSTREHKCWWA